MQKPSVERPLQHGPLKQILQQAESAIKNADDQFVETHAGEHCKLCNAGPELPFSMAFQPIVDVQQGRIMAYEALARGPLGEAALHRARSHAP